MIVDSAGDDLRVTRRRQGHGGLQRGTWEPAKDLVSMRFKNSSESASPQQEQSHRRTSAPTRASFVEIMVEALYAMRIRLDRIRGELNQTVEFSFNREAERMEWRGIEEEVGRGKKVGMGEVIRKLEWEDSRYAASVITLRNRRRGPVTAAARTYRYTLGTASMGPGVEIELATGCLRE